MQVMTEYRSLAHTKAHLSEIIDEVEATQEHVVITRRGKPAVLLLGMDEYESIMETLDALATPGLVEDLKQAEADYAAGKYFTLEDIKRDLENRRE